MKCFYVLGILHTLLLKIFYIGIYLINNVVFQVYSKVIQLYNLYTLFLIFTLAL